MLKIMARFFVSWPTVAAVLMAAADTAAFSNSHGARLPPTAGRPSRTSLRLQRPMSDRHFQLEELEDAETSTTDVVLNGDRTVTLAGTNGPLYVASHGTWSDRVAGPDDEPASGEASRRLFEMTVARTFVTGMDEADATKVGEFEYSVERTYKGECSLVGGSLLSMTGEILDVDEIFGDRRVGFFNMIDTSEERELHKM